MCAQQAVDGRRAPATAGGRGHVRLERDQDQAARGHTYPVPVLLHLYHPHRHNNMCCCVSVGCACVYFFSSLLAPHASGPSTVRLAPKTRADVRSRITEVLKAGLLGGDHHEAPTSEASASSYANGDHAMEDEDEDEEELHEAERSMDLGRSVVDEGDVSFETTATDATDSESIDDDEEEEDSEEEDGEETLDSSITEEEEEEGGDDDDDEEDVHEITV